MSTNLTEANYALNNVPTLANLINTALSWRIFDSFIKSKNELQELNNSFGAVVKFLEVGNTEIKCGFTIKSNVKGMGSEKADLNKLETQANEDAIKTDKVVGGFVLHHTFGTHKIDLVIPLTPQQHTLLHSEIRKLYKTKFLEADEQIKAIYNEFLSILKNAGSGYNSFGKRIKAFEVTIVRIALCKLELFTDPESIDNIPENSRADIYKQALQKLINNGSIPSSLPEKPVKEVLAWIKKQENNISTNSVAEEFNMYSNMWENL